MEVTPAGLQTWLLEQHVESTGSHDPGGIYVNANNDFNHWIVEHYTRDKFAAGRKIVQWIRTHDPDQPGSATNRDALIAELKAGWPVKIHVPNTSGPDGHFVLAYGLVDPTADPGSITDDADILIHDPGNPTRRVANRPAGPDRSG